MAKWIWPHFAMLRVALCCVLLSAAVAWCEIIDGTWIVDNLNECANPDQYPTKITVQKHKYNRTHHSFSFSWDVHEKVDALRFGVVLEAYKKCDGGLKFQQFWNSSSFCSAVNQFARINFERFLSSAGIKPASCPIPTGHFEVKDFVFNYTELPPKGVLGEFHSIMYVVKGGVKQMCLEIDSQFREKSDDDDD